MHYYHLSTDVTIKKIKIQNNTSSQDLTIDNLNENYSGDVYFHAIDDDLFLLMHDDNDFLGNLKRNSLPINLALRKYFPNSEFVGDMLLIKSDDNDMLLMEDWDINILLDYKLKAPTQPIQSYDHYKFYK